MVDTKNLLTSEEAAAYISDLLEAKRGHGWKNPVNSLGVAVMKEQIEPVMMPGDDDKKRIPKRYFTRRECDRFVAAYRKQGGQPADLSPILARLGQASDAELAREAGVSERTVSRARQRLRIEKFEE